MNVPNFKDVEEAAGRLSGHVRATPLIRSDVIDIISGKKVWFKPECSQKVGAFKYRGAFNRLSVLSAQDKSRGVVAYSSGNHAQGVSRAAKELGISAIIVMPSDAPNIKVAGVERDGADIIFYDRMTENREKIADEISQSQGRIIVPSYDDPYIIAGQGTVGLEVAEEMSERGIRLDAFVSPIGGGGLCAGSSLALNALSPSTRIFAAEPEHYNDHQMSFQAGKRTALKSTPPTLCDALMTPIPGELTFRINRQALSGVFAAGDRDCLLAMAVAYKELGVKVEPGGAVAMAAVLTGALDNVDAENIVVVLSGGNVDPEILDRALKIVDPD